MNANTHIKHTGKIMLNEQQTENILSIAEKIMGEGPICDHCLGRQFAQLSTGMDNYQRGRAIHIAIHLARNTPLEEEEDCWVCNNLFKALDVWADLALEALKEYEYSSFLVGTEITGLLAENEELLWEVSGGLHAEPLKSELNREVGKLIQKETGKEVNFNRPDIVIMLSLEGEKVKLQTNSLFIYGRYLKLARGIPQTRWHCRTCRGEGCEECNYTGKMYPTSVEELIGEPIIKTFNASDMILHGCGREDIGARMLGNGRPFVAEVKNPVKRNADLEILGEEINSHCDDKVRVHRLAYADKSMVELVKTVKADKVYRLKILLDDKIKPEKIIYALEKLSGACIEQGTPTRVMHRRSDLVRKRKVHRMKLAGLENDVLEIDVRCEGGLYVKELVSGDGGRTTPSLQGLLETNAEVMELDVMRVLTPGSLW